MSNKIIDLTFNIHQGMMTYPTHWHPKVEITQLGSIEKEGRNTRKITIGSHTGTHVDAPLHFIPGGKTIDTLPLELLTGPAVLLDLSVEAKEKRITADMIVKKLNERSAARLVIRTDWSKKWETPAYYAEYPFLAKDAAEWMVKNGLKLLAMDTPSPDDPADSRASGNDSPLHKFFLGKGVILAEYLCNLDQVKGTDIDFTILPLKITGSDGSPARAIAIERE